MKFLTLAHVRLHQVEVSDRLRAISQGHVDLLKDSIKATGLQSFPAAVAIKGKKFHYRLVSGAHRYEAIKQLEEKGISFEGKGITLQVMEPETDNPEEEIRLFEIDENLIRHELSPYDRAAFLFERKAVYEVFHPEAKKGGDRKSKNAKNQTEIISFSSAASKITGFSDRSIRQYIKIRKDIDDNVWERIRGTKIANSFGELYSLCKLGIIPQLHAVDAILDPDSPIKTVAAYEKSISDMPALDQEEIDLQKLIRLWEKSSFQVQERFREFLNQTVTASNISEAA